MAAFRVSADWIDYAHGPAADDCQPLAAELVELPRKEGAVFIPPSRADLVQEVVSVAQLYDGASSVQDDDRLWFRNYPRNVINRGRKWLQENPVQAATTTTKSDVIYEFRQGRTLLAKYRCPGDDLGQGVARRRFEREFPEWADDLRDGKVVVTSRPPAY
jgi:hypothetical protein